MLTDLRYALRTFVRTPGFAITAAATLALGIGATVAVFGIGATVAVFGIVDGVLLQPLPVRAPDRLVVIWETHPSLRVPFMAASPPHVVQWRGETALFDEVGGFASTKLTIGDAGAAEQLNGALVSGGLMQTLGVPPSLGRLFADEDHLVNAPRVVLLSDGLWRRRFAADRGVVGRPIRLSGDLYTVVGVMPASFNFLPSITIEGKPPLERRAFWVPQPLGDPAQQRGAHFLIAIGRLRPNVTLDAAERRLHALALQNSRAYANDKDRDVRLVPVLAQATASVRPMLVRPVTSREIVGIVADDHHMGVASPVMPNVYLPYWQLNYTGAQSIVVRSTADAATTIAAARREIAAIDPSAAIYNARTLEEIVAASMSTERFSTIAMATFAALALSLALVGIYGVTDEAVSQRASELGIRMALGAEPSRILRLVVGGGFRLAAAGVAFGAVASILLSRFLTRMLFGVSPLEPRTYAGVALILAAAATLAAYVPARRATRIEPNVALRGITLAAPGMSPVDPAGLFSPGISSRCTVPRRRLHPAPRLRLDDIRSGSTPDESDHNIAIAARVWPRDCDPQRKL